MARSEYVNLSSQELRLFQTNIVYLSFQLLNINLSSQSQLSGISGERDSYLLVEPRHGGHSSSRPDSRDRQDRGRE